MTDRNAVEAATNTYRNRSLPLTEVGGDELSSLHGIEVVSMNSWESASAVHTVLHLPKKARMNPVPRPHNDLTLTPPASMFAKAHLPVVNVHFKKRKIEVSRS